MPPIQQCHNNVQGHLQLDQLAQSSVLAKPWTNWMGGASTPLRATTQCFTILIVKNIFVISNLNQPFLFWLKPVPLILIAKDPAKKFILIFNIGFTSLVQLAILLLKQPSWLPWLQMCISSSCKASCQPTPLSYPQGCSQPILWSPCICA